MLRSALPKFLDIKGIKVVRHSNRGKHIYHGGNDALFCYTKFIGGIPPGNIYKNATLKYGDDGHAHRSLRGLIHRLQIKGVLKPRQVRVMLSKIIRGGR
jgi:hypothetical protein